MGCRMIPAHHFAGVEAPAERDTSSGSGMAHVIDLCAIRSSTSRRAAITRRAGYPGTNPERIRPAS